MSTASDRIAVVDDDSECCDRICLLLKEQGHEVSCFSTAGKFFDALANIRYVLTVLDMNLPGMDGKEIIRVLRANPEVAAEIESKLADGIAGPAEPAAAPNIAAPWEPGFEADPAAQP